MADPNKFEANVGNDEAVPHTPMQAELEALADSFVAPEPDGRYQPPKLDLEGFNTQDRDERMTK